MGLRETQSIGRVVIDPRNPNTVFVAAVGHLWGPNDERGLYRTHDGGVTWKKVLGVDENTGVTDVSIADDGRTLIAATYERRRRAWGFLGGGPGSGLWRSLDGGDSWERLTSGLPSGAMGRIGVAIAPGDANIVYAVIEHRDGGVYRSTDRGATWTRRNAINSRPTYFSQIRVDPLNPDRVWLLGVGMWHSVDGGKIFTDDSTADNVHADQHALWIDPRHPGHMMLGTDGGVFFSYDGARHWDYVDNLPLGQFYDIAIDAREPYWIYGGVQDNGTFAFPSASYSRGALTDEEVRFIGYGDGFRVALDPADPRFVYTNSQNGRGYLTDMKTRQERRITPVARDPDDRYRFAWNTAILLSPHDPSTYYLGANKLLKTTDRGTTWEEISPDLTTNRKDWRKLPLGVGLPPSDSVPYSRDDGIAHYGTITTISESPLAAGTIYAGTDDGNVQLTTDGGAHWTDVTSRFRLRDRHWVSTALASAHDPRTAYVAFDGHQDDDSTPYIFRTTDGGDTWQSIAGDLPQGLVVKTVAEDPRNPDLLFAGTEFGLYWSFDGGRHWSFPGGNLPRVMVHRILVNERNGDLVLGTYGRGVIILDDIRALRDGARERFASEVRLFPVRPATEIYRWRDRPLGARVFRAPNPPAGAIITYSLPRGDAADAKSVADARNGSASRDTGRVHEAGIRISAADGSLVRELTGPGGEGLHRVVWDLRAQYAFEPPASDSGYYGAPRAAFVPPGAYTVTLSARGREVSQPLEVRADPRAAPTAEALAARQALERRVDTLSTTFEDGRRSLAQADSEFTSLAALLSRGDTPAAVDSIVQRVKSQLDTLQRDFRSQYGTPMGMVFDLLDGLESNAFPPTDAERRTFEVMADAIHKDVDKLDAIRSNDLPRLRAALASRLQRAADPASTSGREGSRPSARR
jgi:photosystem II stability/assembly factor-like uncharacterized protein